MSGKGNSETEIEKEAGERDGAWETGYAQEITEEETIVLNALREIERKVTVMSYMIGKEEGKEEGKRELIKTLNQWWEEKMKLEAKIVEEEEKAEKKIRKEKKESESTSKYMTYAEITKIKAKERQSEKTGKTTTEWRVKNTVEKEKKKKRNRNEKEKEAGTQYTKSTGTYTRKAEGINEEKLKKIREENVGMEDKEIIKKIEDEIEIGIEHTTIVKRYACRNLMRENIIMEVDGKTYSKVMKQGRINFGNYAARVEEYLEVTVCFRCCGYGHVAKHCRKEREERCYRCGGKHGGEECESREMRCINGKREGKEYRGHGARDFNCNTLLRRQKNSRIWIEYGDEN
ncbi:calponin homology domain-containing protein DDB_G0272472-like [Aethina tumida]|uniref:calponin homology domain-containing protein DDB_G0272472-like n=1 Tax=Aethina tumida TaxID=116153 RepID=UPI002148C38A|nr:calponin homology domain-containing protein DDB_G0272472-like [Aethina tumida]